MNNQVQNIVMMFTSARVKLALWYSFLLLLITLFLSSVFYFRVSEVISSEYARLDHRIEQQWDSLPPQAKQKALDTLRIGAQDLRQVKGRVIRQLFVANAAIFLFFSIAGYVLSGKTLAPIQKAHEEQRRFVGDAAHELKTPIAALKTTLEVNLLDTKLPKSARKVLEMNLQDVSNLEKLAENLLKLAQVSDSQIELKAVAVKSTIESAVSFLKALAKKKQVTIKVTKVDAKLVARTDESGFLELLIILLDNAVKYSEPKTTVSISAVKKGRQCRIEVHDQGQGIPAKDMPHIFKRFYRADNSRTASETEGYGLGLAIAKKIVEQSHGSISVLSKSDSGTTFIVSLPLA